MSKDEKELRVRLAATDHKTLRMGALENDMTLANYVRYLLDTKIEGDIVPQAWRLTEIQAEVKILSDTLYDISKQLDAITPNDKLDETHPLVAVAKGVGEAQKQMKRHIKEIESIYYGNDDGGENE